MLLFIQQNLQSSAVGFSVAVTEGADTLASQVDPVVAFSSATTDGADVLAASVSPVSSSVDFSAAITEGADVLAGQVGPVVGLSSATTDGADTLSGAVSPIVAFSSATTDGADVLAAQVGVVSSSVSFSAALTEGSDTFSALIDSGSSGAGYDYDTPKKRRFFVEQDGKLLVFDTAQQAINADKPKNVSQKIQEKPIEAKPEQVISLPAVKEYAQVIGQIEQYNAAYNSKHFEQLIALFEQMREEDDLEALLLAL